MRSRKKKKHTEYAWSQSKKVVSLQWKKWLFFSSDRTRELKILVALLLRRKSEERKKISDRNSKCDELLPLASHTHSYSHTLLNLSPTTCFGAPVLLAWYYYYYCPQQPRERTFCFRPRTYSVKRRSQGAADRDAYKPWECIVTHRTTFRVHLKRESLYGNVVFSCPREKQNGAKLRAIIFLLPHLRAVPYFPPKHCPYLKKKQKTQSCNPICNFTPLKRYHFRSSVRTSVRWKCDLRQAERKCWVTLQNALSVFNLHFPFADGPRAPFTQRS